MTASTPELGSTAAGGRPLVVVILVNWNGWPDTIACLDSLHGLDYPNFRVIVCDNGSTDDSWAQLVEWGRRAVQESRGRAFPASSGLSGDQPTAAVPAQLTFLQTGANLGFAGGNNRALTLALAGAAEYMWLLNPDTLVTPSALSALVARCEEDRRIGMCGSALVYSHSPRTVQAHGGARLNSWRGYGVQIGHGSSHGAAINASEVEAQLDYVAGASMLVSSSFLRSVGLMDESYFLYYEEADWAERSRGKFRLGFAQESVVYHKEGGSIGTNSTSRHPPFALYYLSASNLRFHRKFYPARLPIITAYLWTKAFKYLVVGARAHSIAITRALLGRPYRDTPSSASEV
jgi:GT2 family glycosyltransferase